MENNLKYIVYLTINLQNNKIYIGVHGTENPNVFDGYIGNGVFINKPSTYNKSKTAFQFAVKKYGVKSFKRIVLKTFDTLKEALDLEAKLVDEAFVKRRDTYNLTLGGGLPTDTSIEVYQYSLDGEFIKSWKSSVEASKYFNVSYINIRQAVKLKCTSCGYLWTDVYMDKLNTSEFKVNISHEHVYKFNSLNKIVGKYNSVRQAAKENNSTPRLILSSISGRTKSKNFYYSYDENFKIDDSVYNKLTNVYLYNLDGSFYKEFSSPRECADFFGDIKTSRIYSAKRTGGLYKNYQISDVKLPYMKKLVNPTTPKKIGQYDLDGKLIKIWDTIQSAYLVYGAGIKKCLKGAQNKSKGFVWKYIN